MAIPPAAPTPEPPLTSPASPAAILRCERAALEAIDRHARAVYPDECCGALVGRDDRAVDAWPLDNVSDEDQRRRFLVSPRAYLATERRAAGAGLSLLGIYHSHPDHPARPSATDLAAAWPTLVYAIVSVRGGEVAERTAWRLRDDRSGFDEITFRTE
jgi:proteasome lid subunit RPN8/RPN11